ncbi:hypothetical protein EJV47_19565 [Hymenobacter gummosus]|uniref:Spondin domain-containing protein n=1 Tax=Hymenobacter gummosus TaxID=1776032 RepID=A0A431TY52_9BACT|nr:spondin domain-containing protein [Hymenobacter gummosus]RTQ47097.1 hypothetical protein EJV47_19565 [Hymenobacter gummosus]
MKRLLLLPLLALLLGACEKDPEPRSLAGDPGTAKYRIIFRATWSAATHPQAYPAGAHFSRLIGAAHGTAMDGAEVLFRPDHLASPGLKDMAERGNNTILRTELLAHQGAGLPVREIFENNLAYIDSPGQFVDTVQVDGQHPLVSAVTMIAPSPDWFVALHEQSLLDERGQWLPALTVVARAYDAGTDSGPDFDSPDQPTTPARPVAPIVGAPLAPGGTSTPLGTFYLERIQ